MHGPTTSGRWPDAILRSLVRVPKIQTDVARKVEARMNRHSLRTSTRIWVSPQDVALSMPFKDSPNRRIINDPPGEPREARSGLVLPWEQ